MAGMAEGERGQGDQLRLGDRVVDLGSGIVHCDGVVHRLTRIELDLLVFLSSRPGQDVSREELHREVWGHNVTLATRAVDFAVRRLRKKIEAVPSSPSHLVTAYGVGYRFEVPAEHSLPSAPRVDEIANRFVGREAELDQLDRLTRSPARLVTVAGLGGMGKTRLVRHFARMRDPGPAGGVWFADLQEAVTAADLIAGVAGALGIRTEACGDEQAAADLVGDSLADRGDCLLVLDNLEQVVDHTGWISQWLRCAPNLRVISTSRELLGLPGEHLLELPPLDHASAMRLFIERARATGSPPRPDTHEAVAELVEALDRVPLAIELAAARSRVLGPVELRRRLADHLALLTTRDRQGRQGTLTACLDWSWQLLGDDERRTLSDCLVFRGGFDLETAEGILAPGDDGLLVVDLIERLRDRSLLEATWRDGSLRFRLSVSVRAFVASQGPTQDPLTAVRHADWFLRAAEAHAEELLGLQGRAARRWVAENADNLLVAWRHLLPTDADRAARIVDVLARVAVVDGGDDRLRRAIDRSLEDLEPCTELRSRLLLHRSRLRRAEGDHDRARADAFEALAMAPAALQPDARLELGALFRSLGRAAEAERQYRLASAPPASRRTRGAALTGLAELLMARFDHAAAEAAWQEARELFKRARELRGECGVLLARAAHQGDGPEALTAARRSARLAERLGDRELQGVAELAIARQLRVQGRPAEAGNWFRAVARTRARLGQTGPVPEVELALGMVALDQGEHARARRHFERADEQCGPERQATLLAATGRLHLDQGQLELANVHLRRAIELGAGPAAQGDLGAVMFLAGRLQEAETMLGEAIAACGLPRHQRLRAIFRGRLVGVLVRDGRHDEAATLADEARSALVAAEDPVGLAALKVYEGAGVSGSTAGPLLFERRLALRARGWATG